MNDFYSDIAPIYHLLFPDWQASIERQAQQLTAIIHSQWGDSVTTVLDASAGIGTQTLGLAAAGFQVTASDICATAVDRLRKEAEVRELAVQASVADLRDLSSVHGLHDLVIVCDNSLPHLLTDEEIEGALLHCLRCVRPGGGCLITVRDYPDEPRQGTEFHPYATQVIDGKKTFIFQIWDWHGRHYDVSLCLLEDSGSSEECCRVHRSSYYAIPAKRILELMKAVGFTSVQRLDDVFYQPVLIGERPAPTEE